MHMRRFTQLLFRCTALAHMSLWYPAPLGGAKEANSLTTRVDDKLNFPLGCCDADGAPTLASPGDCRGHLNLLDTDEGEPQVTWEPGQNAHFELSDYTYTIGAPGSTHYGGSCQIGFSIDKGQTWRVAASYHGNCPHRADTGNQIFNFRVPTGLPTGPAVFAWVWLNREHESFMNCASVQIGSGSNNVTVPSQGIMARTSKTRMEPSPRHTDPPREEDSPYTSGRYDIPTSECSNSAAKHTRRQHEQSKHMHSFKRRQDYFLRAAQSMTLRGSKSLKRVPDVCDWDSAPTMETSYYTTDAKCAAGAKTKKNRKRRF
ncbi:hypothetical protein BKA63DRAFT_497836 [Paraphoma chrysanthemicola]|nr:hypothetical protein BKA63DRAFT_497836 [Paraphoma chrysanthemicola]